MPPERRKGSQIPPPSGLGMKPKSLIPKSGACPSSSGVDLGNGIVRVDETSKPPYEKTPSPVDSELFSKWNEWIGQRVCVGGAKRGILRFFGSVEFQTGIWCGVELFEPVGKNDGSVNGIRYFSCEDNYGIFAPVKKVEKLSLSHNLPHSGPLREPGQTEDSVQIKSKLPAPRVASKFPVQTGKFIPSKNIEADDQKRKVPPPKTFFSRDNNTTLKNQCENINVTQTFESETFHSDDYQVGEKDKTYSEDVQESIDNEVFQRGLLNVSYTVDTEGNSSNGYQAKQDLNQTFHMTKTPVDNKFEQGEIKDRCNTTFDTISTKQPTEKLNSTFDMEYTPCVNSVSTLGGNETNTTFNLEEQSHITEYLMRRPGELLNQVEGHNLDYIFEEDDECDDGLSLDFEDSLGILTPNQMKDFTLYSEHHSIITDFDAMMLPKTFSCDEMNELPESEVVEDVTIEYRDASSQETQRNTCSSVEDTNTLTKESKSSLSADKIITRDPQGSLECLPELIDDKSDAVNYFAEDAFHTSTPSSVHDKYSTRSLLLKSVEYGLDNSLCQHLIEETSTPPAQVDTLGKLPMKILENEYYRDEFLKDGVYKETDVSRVEDQELPSLTLLQESYSSVGGLIENTLVTATARPSQVSGDVMNEGKLLDSLNLKKLDNEKSDTHDKPLTCSQEISDHSERSNEMTNSKVFVPVNEDQVFSRETSFDSKERPLSTYTVCSADTGFQGDLDLEVGEEYNMRFSTYSQDSGTVSLGPEIEQQLRSRNEIYSKEMDFTMEEIIRATESQQPILQQYEVQDDLKWEGKVTNEPKEMLRCQENGDIFSLTPFANEVKMEDSLSPVIRTTSFIIDATSTEKNEVNSTTIPASHLVTDSSVKDQIQDRTPDGQMKEGKMTNKEESSPLADKSGKNTVREEPRKKVKTPKKNVMSKIKAMIESTSGKKTKNDTIEGETKKTPKKSRWDAVTSKIKASLDEEKSKPKSKKEIKSRIDTNLALARQPQEKKSFTTKSDASVNEKSTISGRLSRKSKNASKSQSSQEQVCVSPIIMDSLYSHEDNNLSSISRSSTLNFTSSLSEVLPSNYISVNSQNLKNSLTSKSALSPTLSAPPSEMSTASLASHGSRSQSQVVIQKKNLAAKTGPKPTKTPPTSVLVTVSSKSSTGKSQQPTHKQSLAKKEPVKKTTTSSTKQPLLSSTLSMPISSTIKKSSHPARATSARNISSSKHVQMDRRESNQGQAKVRSSLAPSITGERRKTQGEYLLEIQRLEALCETRTKELNWLKLQLKHATLGFDSLTVLIKYLADDLDAFSNPRLANEVEKSREDLRKTETQLNQYQEEVEHLKKCHTKEVVTLREELDLVHKDELARLVFKHEKEVEELKNEYHEKVVGLTETHAKASKEVQEKHSSEIQALKEQHKKLLEDLEKNFTVRLKDMEQSHEAVVLSLREQNHKLQQQLEELQQEKQSVEDALKQDTDSKIQLIMNQKTDLKKEVESLKTVLEMKKCEIQNLRTENLKMQKDLEELSVAKEQVEKLKARNEDLQARVDEKVEQERQLSCEQVKLRESYEKESKVNKRLSMEKEELVWKLKQTMEASILLSSPTGDTPAIDRLDQLAKDYTLRKSPIRMSVFFDTLDANSSYYKHSSPGQKSGHLASPRTRSLRQGSNSSPSTPNKKRRPRSLETEKSPERKVSTMADVKICLKYNEDECQQGTQEDNTQDLSKTFPIGDVELTPTEEIVEVVSQAPVHKEQYSNELPEKHQEAPKICTATAVLSENSDLATDSLREELMQETMESPKTMTDVQKTTTILLCSGDSSSSTSSNVEQYDIVKQVHIRTKSIDQPSGAGEQLATTLVSAGIPEVDGSWQGSMTSSGSSWSMGLDVGDNKEIAVEEHAEKVNDFNESSEDRSESSSEQDDYPVAPRCLAGEAMIPEESPPSITESSSEGSPVSKRPCHKDKQDSSVKLIDGTEESSDGIFTLDDGEQGPLQEGNDVNWCDDDLPSETEV
ncbi:uncharacterized protein LOC143230215 isoform X3 [Tachypleus tridentatus]|uniref:uncharacterized protein LOC143230215 isoform X2 n=1 Tax=Tachypleus tridentatus TaxID=6853 RepID=UPI003FD0CC34